MLKRLLVSAQFWVLVCLLALMCLPLAVPVKWPLQFWIKQGFNYLLWAGTFYINSRFIVPRVLFKGQTGWFIILVLISLVAIIQLNHQFDVLLNLKALLSKAFNGKKSGAADIGDLILVIISLIIFGMSTVVAVVQRLQADQLRGQTLEKEKITAELSFLKTQINPHFFFNVLHTIYALIETDMPTAKDSVYTLSHMMRYVLYETKNDTVSLHKEVAFVEDYIKLMKLRMGDNVQIIVNKPDFLKDIQLAPMLFLPFVENAFKHGISNVHPSYVYIGIKQDNQQLQIEVRNSIVNEKADHMEESTGIGLVNTQRRLNLSYPGQHELVVERNSKEHEFTVVLKLLLA